MNLRHRLRLAAQILFTPDPARIAEIELDRLRAQLVLANLETLNHQAFAVGVSQRMSYLYSFIEASRGSTERTPLSDHDPSRFMPPPNTRQ